MHIFAILVLFCLSISAQAANTATSELNHNMTELGKAISTLIPIALDNDDLNTPKVKAKLAENIAVLSNTLPKVKPHFDNKSLTYQLSFGIISRHIDDLKLAFDKSRYHHVRSMIRATAEICVSCHSQDRIKRKLFVGFKRQQFKSDFSYAEYNFVTRNYPVAEDYYVKYLQHPGKHDSEPEQLLALRHLLIIYAQILNNVSKGKALFSKIQTSSKLTVYANKQVEDWISSLEAIGKLPKHDKDKDFAGIKRLVTKYLSDKLPAKLAYHYWIRGMAYRYLSASPKHNEVPVLLYWLALADRDTPQSYYYSLSDLYLKECMLVYSAHPIAKQCYDAYEESMIYSYSGSRGTDIPDDIVDVLKDLKMLVYK